MTAKSRPRCCTEGSMAAVAVENDCFQDRVVVMTMKMMSTLLLSYWFPRHDRGEGAWNTAGIIERVCKMSV